MPLPQRPNAIVLGSHEDDITMTEGLKGMSEYFPFYHDALISDVSGLSNQLSIGFLELTEELPQRIAVRLSLRRLILHSSAALLDVLERF